MNILLQLAKAIRVRLLEQLARRKGWENGNAHIGSTIETFEKYILSYKVSSITKAIAKLLYSSSLERGGLRIKSTKSSAFRFLS